MARMIANLILPFQIPQFMRAALMSVVALFLASCASPVAFTGQYVDGRIFPADVSIRTISTPGPRYLGRGGGESSAVVAYMVEKDGSTSQVQLVSATDDELGKAACEAVMHWRFTPPMKDGVLVRVARQVPFVFHSNSHEAGPHGMDNSGGLRSGNHQ
jgi:TonB family protein